MKKRHFHGATVHLKCSTPPVTLWHEEGEKVKSKRLFSGLRCQIRKLIPKPVDPVFSDFKETFKYDGLSQRGTIYKAYGMAE